MAPKFYRWTKTRLLKLRKASLAALLAFVPTVATDAPLDFTVGRAGCVAAPIASPVVVACPPLPSVDFDLTREDARITCHNPRRGTTAEFLIQTIAYGALTGKRIASVLTDGQWVGFAFVDDFGLTVWTRLRGHLKPSVHQRYATFLEDLGSALANGVVVEITRFD